MDLVLFTALFAFGYIVSPALTMYSWARWFRSQRRHSRRVRLSLAGLVLASTALLLGITAVAISSRRHRTFLYIAPDHRLLYGAGLALSSLAVLLTLIGALHDNPIRLKALLSALGSLSFWFLVGSE